MRYIVIIIMLAITVSVAGCATGDAFYAWGNGAEKLAPGYIVDGYRWYHMGNMDVETWTHPDTGEVWTWNTVELNRFPRIMDIVVNDDRTFDGPFGKDAESFTDSQRRAMYLNLWCPNTWWDGGFAPPAPDGSPTKAAFDGHLTL